MPQVRDRLVAELNMEPEIYDPDEAVAKGAALYALKESLLDQVQDFLTTQTVDRWAAGQAGGPVSSLRGRGGQGPRPSGTAARIHADRPGARAGEYADRQRLEQEPGRGARNEQSQDVVVYLLPRNSEVPLERLTDFGTDVANQAAVDIRVMSGERDSADPLDCQEVGVASLNLPEKLPARARSGSSSPSARMAVWAFRRPI